jgi:hypothetical protein
MKVSVYFSLMKDQQRKKQPEATLRGILAPEQKDGHEIWLFV